MQGFFVLLHTSRYSYTKAGLKLGFRSAFHCLNETRSWFLSVNTWGKESIEVKKPLLRGDGRCSNLLFASKTGILKPVIITCSLPGTVFEL